MWTGPEGGMFRSACTLTGAARLNNKGAGNEDIVPGNLVPISATTEERS